MIPFFAIFIEKLVNRVFVKARVFSQYINFTPNPKPWPRNRMALDHYFVMLSEPHSVTQIVKDIAATEPEFIEKLRQNGMFVCVCVWILSLFPHSGLVCVQHCHLHKRSKAMERS